MERVATANSLNSGVTHCAIGTLLKNVKPQPILQANPKLTIHEVTYRDNNSVLKIHGHTEIRDRIFISVHGS